VARISLGEQTFKMNPPVLATRIGPDPRFEDVIAEPRVTPRATRLRHFPGIPGGW